MTSRTIAHVHINDKNKEVVSFELNVTYSFAINTFACYTITLGIKIKYYKLIQNYYFAFFVSAMLNSFKYIIT